MNELSQFLDGLMLFFRTGFNQVNAYLGLIIALIASFQLSNWRKLWEAALAALIFHILALALAPVVDHGAPLRMPAILDPGVLRNWLAIYVGYIILIAVFFFLRTRLLKPVVAHH
ncbi:hypothetical protein [Rhizomicrobium palustre]|nr:hypothetical protein [Rhizomicrobium palustre]